MLAVDTCAQHQDFEHSNADHECSIHDTCSKYRSTHRVVSTYNNDLNVAPT